MRAVVVASILLIAARAADAEPQIWTSFVGQVRFGEQSGPALWLDLHDRRRSDSTLVIVRPGVGYAFSPDFAAHVGYAFVPTVVDDDDNATEHRLWQQVIGQHAFGNVAKVQGRARLEQRFGPGDDMGYRLRLLGRGQLTLSSDVPLQLVVTDEVFLGLNDTDWAAKSGFDQNRLFAGVGVDTAIKGVRVEVGYMNVYLNAQDRFDNIVAANVTMNLAL